jgi:hypothetical protein
MTPHEGPSIPDSALDFLRLVSAKEKTPGLPFLDDDELAYVSRLLSTYDANGATPSLDRQARTFLVMYRERNEHSPVLSDKERARLSHILDEPASSSRLTRPTFQWPSSRALLIAATICTLLIVAAVIGIRAEVMSHQSGPPAGISQAQPPAQQVAPGTTDLQNLKQAWGPWQTQAPSDQRPQTGSPALLLLENGGYSSSEKWTISPGAAGWQRDLGGHVTNVDIRGNLAAFTDGDDFPYVVGIGQPFIEASDPNTVLRIDATRDVLSISLAQATAERQPIR